MKKERLTKLKLNQRARGNALCSSHIESYLRVVRHEHHSLSCAVYLGQKTTENLKFSWVVCSEVLRLVAFGEWAIKSLIQRRFLCVYTNKQHLFFCEQNLKTLLYTEEGEGPRSNCAKECPGSSVRHSIPKTLRVTQRLSKWQEVYSAEKPK